MPTSSKAISKVDKSTRLLFVVNPAAGQSNTNWTEEINNFLRETVYSYEVFELPGECNADHISQIINTSRATRVVAVGGDGTIKLVATSLINSGKELGIIPGGSANGLAKELGIPTNPEAALESCLSTNVKNIHLVKVNGELCIHLADIGFNAFLVKTFEEQTGRGMWGYIKAALKTVWRHPHMEISIHAEDKEIKKQAAMVVIANATRYGSGALINPLGRLDDDLFEVVVVKKISLSEIFKMMVTHKPYDTRKTEVFQAGQISILSRRKAHFQVDGEYLGKTSTVNASILKDALRVVLPE